MTMIKLIIIILLILGMFIVETNKHITPLGLFTNIIVLVLFLWNFC